MAELPKDIYPYGGFGFFNFIPSQHCVRLWEGQDCCLRIPVKVRSVSQGRQCWMRNHRKFIQWDITHRCNLQCAHCRSTEFYRNRQVEDLSLADNKKIAQELCLNGVRRVHFLGGEPLLRDDFPELVGYMVKLGIDCSVNTNGTLLTTSVAERLIDAGISIITVSLDGPDAQSNDAVRGKGVFAPVCRNIEQLTQMIAAKKKATRVVVACTLVKGNIGKLRTMALLIKRLGVDNLILSPLRLSGNAIDHAADLSPDQDMQLAMGEEIAATTASGDTVHLQLGFPPIVTQYLNEKYATSFPVYATACNAIRVKGYLQPDGALFPCQALTDTADKRLPIGPLPRRSLVDHSFAEIWNSSELQNIEALLYSEEIKNRMLPCRYCRYFPTICYPCPLTSLRGKTTIKYMCLKAMAKMAKIRGQSVPWENLLAATNPLP
ncbi:MAG TPA: radical SAM protein [Malonomonas sp.]